MKWISGGVNQLPNQHKETLPVGVQLGGNMFEFSDNGWEMRNNKESDDRYLSENKRDPTPVFRLNEQLLRIQADLDLARCNLMEVVEESNGVKFQNQLLLDLLAVARVDKRQGEHLLKRTMLMTNVDIGRPRVKVKETELCKELERAYSKMLSIEIDTSPNSA